MLQRQLNTGLMLFFEFTSFKKGTKKRHGIMMVEKRLTQRDYIRQSIIFLAVAH